MTDLTLGVVLLLVATGLGIGGLIGMTGIGGLLLPPALVHIGGLTFHEAVATSAFAFLFTGLAGTVAYVRQATVSRTTASWIVVGSAPAAAAGAVVGGWLSGDIIAAALSAVVVGGGALALSPPRRTPVAGERSTLPAATLVALAAAVGFLAAMTGTGGPVLLVPALLLIGLAPLAAVGTAQTIQLPVAAAASVAYFIHDQIDLEVGTLVGCAGLLGVWLGSRVAARLPRDRLRRLVGMVLVVAGVAMVVQIGVTT